jgi:short-subunit dehydrogenase
VLFSAELARRLEGSGVTTYALHPGVVATDVWRHVPDFARGLMKLWMVSPEEGARTTLYCATSPEAGRESGLYYDRERMQEPNAAAQDPALARELWQRSAEWTANT